MLLRAPDSTALPARTAPAATGRSPALHRWALVTLLAMFPLIWFGGLTTSHGAGLAVPDWPNTYNYNMFAAPWGMWLGQSAGGIFFEHTHRLLGSLAGLFAIAATLWAWGTSRDLRWRRWWGRAALFLGLLAVASFILLRLDVAGAHRLFGHLASGFGGLGIVSLLGWLARTREPRRWARWTATGLLAAIVVQGILGGLRVTEVNVHLAVVHGVFAQLTLCLAGFLVLATSAWWADILVLRLDDAAACAQRGLIIAAGALTVIIVAQLIVASMMRHYQAGLAVPDFPLSYGRLMPPVSADGLERANELRVFDHNLPPTNLALIWLHTAHRVGAVLVTLGVLWVWWRSRLVPGDMRPRRLVGLLIGLLVLQVCLGVATVWWAKPADVATAHVATGALLLLVSWILTIRTARRYGWPAALSASWAADALPPRQTAAHGAVQVPLSA